jgi:hypothetical protein
VKDFGPQSDLACFKFIALPPHLAIRFIDGAQQLAEAGRLIDWVKPGEIDPQSPDIFLSEEANRDDSFALKHFAFLIDLGFRLRGTLKKTARPRMILGRA